ncbi:MAG TPA: hypothetical protein VGS19_01575 [Streptosporangiaceae bacterium]|nr:hypothetical protein [Streptosporangiaceae bacterium]
MFADYAEKEVIDRVLTALDDPATLARLLAGTTTAGTRSNDVSGRLREIETQREELAALWAAKEIDRKEWLTARSQLRDEADTLTAQLGRSQHARALVEFAAMEGGLWDRWGHLIPGGQRALITAVIDHIDVRPVSPTGRRFDLNRITDPTWRA